MITNFSAGARAGTFSAIAAATVLPVAIRSTWPDTKAAMVALLSSKRLTVASGGAEAVSACSSIAPRVAPMVLPLRSAALATAIALVPNTPEKNGA